MLLENGKKYIHKMGRAISIVGEVKTDAWGMALVVEETDPSGHSVSFMARGAEDTADNWSEITDEQWAEEFKKDYHCFYCKKMVEPGQQYRPTEHGFIHEDCIQKFTAEEDD